MNSPTEHHWTLTRNDAGQRLDLFLARQLNVGRTWVRRLLQAQCVHLDGRMATLGDKGRLLSSGMVIDVRGGASDALQSEPQAPLSILSQGPGWIIADKPPGQAVHPLRPGEGGTLLNALAGRYPQMAQIGEGGLRGGVVHRLDIQTSGVILFATDQPSWQAFRDAFARHQTEKIYQALVHGQPPDAGQCRMELYIARHRPALVRVAPPDHRLATTRPCVLQWRTIERFAHASRLEIRLGTGFLHQIRVMFAEMGHPVIGDPTYGRADPAIASRQMLHAWRLHVLQAEAVSPVPGDFQQAVERLR